MNRTLTSYATPGKAKSLLIVGAFARGASGTVTQQVAELEPGAAAFYGVTAATKPVYSAARAQGRDVYYLDNAYLDPLREVYFRATRNRLQHPGTGESNCKRFDRAGIPIAPWRANGGHVLLCPQSDQFMRDVVEYPGSWLADTLAALGKLTDRPLRVRPWTGNKREWYRSLPEDLQDCWALVTYSSASAITAVLSGVPAISTADDAIARPVTGRLEQIEAPPLPDDRREWAGVVADNHWTLDEFRDGTAWRMLHG